MYEFSQLDGWIDVATPICPKDSGLCFLENYDSGWRRIMKLDLSSKSAIYVTEELYWVLGIYGYNAQTDKLFAFVLILLNPCFASLFYLYYIVLDTICQHYLVILNKDMSLKTMFV